MNIKHEGIKHYFRAVNFLEYWLFEKDTISDLPKAIYLQDGFTAIFRLPFKLP